jgi:hypothetical protein
MATPWREQKAFISFESCVAGLHCARNDAVALS